MSGKDGVGIEDIDHVHIAASDIKGLSLLKGTWIIVRLEGQQSKSLRSAANM
jgi:hypothetical protein